MRICFEYKNIRPEDLATALKALHQKYTDTKGTDDEPIEWGKINLYVSFHNASDGNPLNAIDPETGEEVYWVVKDREMKKTDKEPLGHIKDEAEEGRKLFIYSGIKNSRLHKQLGRYR